MLNSKVYPLYKKMLFFRFKLFACIAMRGSQIKVRKVCKINYCFKKPNFGFCFIIYWPINDEFNEGLKNLSLNSPSETVWVIFPAVKEFGWSSRRLLSYLNKFINSKNHVIILFSIFSRNFIIIKFLSICTILKNAPTFDESCKHTIFFLKESFS